MIMTITLILSFLVLVNFLLLIFSCNKTLIKKADKTTTVLKTKKTTVITTKLAPSHLAPTGS